MYESPRLRGYPFVGIVVFPAVPYTRFGPGSSEGSYDSCHETEIEFISPMINWNAMSGDGAQHDNRYSPTPLARLVRCGLSSKMRRGKRPRVKVPANTVGFTVYRDRQNSIMGELCALGC